MKKLLILVIITILLVLSGCSKTDTAGSSLSSTEVIVKYEYINSNVSSNDNNTTDNENSSNINSSDNENNSITTPSVSEQPVVDNNSENITSSEEQVPSTDNSDDYNLSLAGEKFPLPLPSDYNTPAISNPEARYATLQLYTKTTYYGYEGFFFYGGDLSFSDTDTFEKIGITCDEENGIFFMSTNSEFYEKDTEKCIHFAFAGDLFLQKDLFNHVLAGNIGQGSTPVYTVDNR